jgi:hypothetical protein
MRDDMDPNVTLKRIRECQHLIRVETDTPRITYAYEELNELVTALDEWLSLGGFLPDPWVRP